MRSGPLTDADLDRDIRAMFHDNLTDLPLDAQRATGYFRVSTMMQYVEGTSIEDQEKRIRAEAAARKWDLVNVYSDPARSATKDNRPGLQRLLRAVRNHQVDIVVIDRIDRLSRNLLGLLRIIHTFREHRVRLVSLRENIDFNSHWGRLVLYVLGALAEFYVSALSEEIRIHRLQRA
jgi:site-specific DNA recombinase